MDNNILTDFMELTAASEINYMVVLNQLFNKVIIPVPILDDENIYNNLGSFEYEKGVFETDLGFKIFMELGKSENKMAKKLSKYDRHVIAIAGEVDILAVSNDKPVRELCNSYDIKITGTLGVVCSAYENDLISFKVMVEGLEFLFSEESTCYLSNSLKRKIFKYYSI
ncbi:MAG: hypothetical protein ACQEP9_08885 [Bacillota bacterium]